MGNPIQIPSASPEELLQVRANQLRVVLQSSPKNLAMSFVAASLMAFAVWRTAAPGWPQYAPWMWWTAITLGLARGLWLGWRFWRSGQSDEEALRIAPVFRMNAAFRAALWGSASWLLLPTDDLHTEVFLFIAMALVFTGGAASQAVYRPLLLSFLIPGATVFAAGLFRFGDFFHVLLGTAFPLLSFVIIAAARPQQDAVQAATLLRIQTQTLLGEKIEQQLLTDNALREAEQAREEAERANQGKTSFLTAASHDLRQPMHALVQYVGHLQRRNRDAALTETLERASKSLDAMQDLLDSILEVSKLMMGAVRPVLRPFPIRQVLERLDAQLRPLAEAKGLAFSIEQEPAWVQTDEILLERVLRNLVINAIRYTETGKVRVLCEVRDGALRVRVVDTGIGIRQENLGRIFDEFFQVENEARDRRKGLGLGLSLVRQLCALLQLSVHVESTFGAGSVFSVDIPVCKPAAASHALATTTAHDYLQGAFVVLIDDDETSLQATGETLLEFGCRVLRARSGMEAIEKLQGQECAPQLVISDYRLEGGQTGIEAIHMVQENQRVLLGDDFRLAALVVSGDTAPAELLKVQEAGFPMLHKPVKLGALYDAMNDRLRTLALDGN